MSKGVAIVTGSGFGKSTSIGHIPELGIEGLDPNKTLVINVKGKPLPFRGWRKQYKPIDISQPPLQGNYLETTDPHLIIKTLQFFDANRFDIENIVIDDFQYLMAEQFMNDALKTGYEKFSKLAKNAYDVINSGLKMRDSVNFIILTHSEVDMKGDMKMKTIGKLLDEKITLEGLFTIILYGKSSYDNTEKKSTKEFVTNFDGEFPSKSPIGLFKDLYIKNDLGLVVKTMNDYYDGE